MILISTEANCIHNLYVYMHYPVYMAYMTCPYCKTTDATFCVEYHGALICNVCDNPTYVMMDRNGDWYLSGDDE